MFLRSFLAAAAVGGALYATPTESAPALRQPAFISAPLSGMRKSGSISAAPSGRAAPAIGLKMQGTDTPVNSALLSREEAMKRSKANEYEWEWSHRQAFSTTWDEVKAEFVKAFGVSADKWDSLRSAIPTRACEIHSVRSMAPPRRSASAAERRPRIF